MTRLGVRASSLILLAVAVTRLAPVLASEAPRAAASTPAPPRDLNPDPALTLNPAPSPSKPTEPNRFVPSLRPGVPSTVTLAIDGSLSTPAPARLKDPGEEAPAARRLIWRFGLPDSPPEDVSLLQGRLPIHTTTWLKNGIQYTQTVLLTTLDEEPAGAAIMDVLLVQLTGENTASEYTDADATLEVELAGRPLPLRLESGLVGTPGGGGGEHVVIAAIGVPAEGVEATDGEELRFHGHMPPGTSGAMTVKIPLGPVDGEASENALLDLVFDEQFRKVRRAWEQRLPVPRPGPSWLTE